MMLRKFVSFDALTLPSCILVLFCILLKYAYAKMMRILKAVKMIIFRKKGDIFLIFAQNIDCGGSNEYPQSVF